MRIYGFWCPGQDISIDCAYLSDGPLPTNLTEHFRDSRPTLNWLLIQMMSTDANDLIVA
jgi:hypothetical protein